MVNSAIVSVCAILQDKQVVVDPTDLILHLQITLLTNITVPCTQILAICLKALCNQYVNSYHCKVARKSILQVETE